MVDVIWIYVSQWILSRYMIFYNDKKLLEGYYQL
jgi:hypothetical protein